MEGSRRFVAALAAALASVALGGAPALAAPPANDTYPGAVTIAAIPFTTTQDTSEATTDADDTELNATCGAPAMDASVWYAITPTEGATLLADVSQSSYSAGVLVATGAPGSFETVACGPSAIAWDATAGETYYIVVIDDQGDGSGNGGQMTLSVDVAPPPPTLDVTVNDTGRFDARTGSVFISGTARCGSEAVMASLEAQVTQRVGRILIRGFGGAEVTCDDTVHPWQLEIVGDNGLFKGGKAVSATFSFACSEFACSQYLTEQRIQLNGKKS